ncbi:MAG: cytidine deaminase [Elusimicrobia bacterium]|nr:cytidine deaminase [Elusimicrobiota bacterium]
MTKLPRQILRLIDTAVSAQKNAYCPYSRYPVGAAVLTDGGRIFAGTNVENASYGLSLCAERVAIFNAITRRQTGLKAICVVASLAKPCGACRQVMFEFSTKDTLLYLVSLNPNNRRQSITRTTVHKMLPAAFDPLASGLLAANPKNLLRNRQKRR